MLSVDKIKKQLFIDSVDVCGNTMVDIYEAQESCDKAYNNAIDDFVSSVQEWNKTSSKKISYVAIGLIAEQLKAGGKNER